jgi:hypothetical protein
MTTAKKPAAKTTKPAAKHAPRTANTAAAPAATTYKVQPLTSLDYRKRKEA